ncbi:hypothetical protein [Paenibacillus sp. B2(2019)]|uniref:hypothetical protein n=1 Tax=Paenibacillus sp. B2(2019) TaxID=2607754 RepID=UPI00165F28C9|nr:hypothetical protein [Paenibacillus sp. B2(2019)]
MSLFSQTITDFWRKQFLNGDILYTDEVATVAINTNLDKDSLVMAVLMHAMADKVSLYQRQDLSVKIIRRKLNEAGVTLHGGDYLFYFSEADENVLLQENLKGDFHWLTEQDEAAFSEFESWHIWKLNYSKLSLRTFSRSFKYSSSNRSSFRL